MPFFSEVPLYSFAHLCWILCLSCVCAPSFFLHIFLYYDFLYYRFLCIMILIHRCLNNINYGGISCVLLTQLIPVFKQGSYFPVFFVLSFSLLQLILISLESVFL